MKRVYLIRHGRAADAGYREDGDRPLTDEGRAQMRRNAAALVPAAGVAPAAFLCSPLVRATQTCEIVVAAFGVDGPVEITRALLPSGSVSDVEAAIDQRPEASLALVGHEPLLSSLASHLLGRPALGTAFRKGAVLAIDLARRGSAGTLAFHLAPADDDREPEVQLHL